LTNNHNTFSISIKIKKRKQLFLCGRSHYITFDAWFEGIWATATEEAASIFSFGDVWIIDDQMIF